jgi:hypothetical protein
MADDKLKRARMIRNVGGGGCGCTFLLLLVASVLLVFGLSPKTDEALPFAFVTYGVASLVGFVAVVLFIWGLVSASKASKP